MSGQDLRSLLIRSIPWASGKERSTTETSNPSPPAAKLRHSVGELVGPSTSRSGSRFSSVARFSLRARLSSTISIRSLLSLPSPALPSMPPGAVVLVGGGGDVSVSFGRSGSRVCGGACCGVVSGYWSVDGWAGFWEDVVVSFDTGDSTSEEIGSAG